MTSQYLSGDVQGIKAFVDRFDVFLLDCDGVLWSGEHIFDGTIEILQRLRAKGKRVVFVTNNSTKSRAAYSQKLQGLGIPATNEDIFSSSYSAAVYISRILRLPSGKNKVFVIGESGIEEELACEGLESIGGSDTAFRREMTASDYTGLASGAHLDEQVGIVLAGLDRHLNYLKLAHAYHYITQSHAIFLATNSDTTLPSSNALFPGAGACAAPLVAMLNGQKPESLGKPSLKMLDAIENKFAFDRKRACMVGDRLDTDIAFGNEGALGGTLAVLTGVTKEKTEWEGESNKSLTPSAYVDRLADLLEGFDP